MKSARINFAVLEDLSQHRYPNSRELEVMAVVSSIHMVVVTHAGALVTLGTVLLCYTIAVSLGHVPAWLPMISDCAVDPPEKYIFRLGIVIDAMILALNTVVVYKVAGRAFSNSKLGLILGLVGCAALAVVGVVNENENGYLHLGTKHLVINDV